MIIEIHQGLKGDKGEQGESWNESVGDGRVPARSGTGTVNATLDNVPDSAARKAVTSAQSAAVEALTAALTELLAIAALGSPPASGKWLQGDPTAEGGISEKGWAERNAWYENANTTINLSKGINQTVQLTAGANTITLGDQGEDGASYKLRLLQPTSGSTPGTITISPSSPDVVKIAAPGVLSLSPTISGWNDLILTYCRSGARFSAAPVWTVYLLPDAGP